MNIPHNKPSLDENEINAMQDVINSGWIAQGEKVEEFENEICKYIGLKEKSAVALSNGTSALYLALTILGVNSSKDEVIIPSYVCTAVLNAVNMCKAIPIIVDVDEIDFNINYDEIKNEISKNTKAIIVPHTFGVPADVINIKNLGIPIIEDCAQALGSKIQNSHVGQFGDFAIFSFYASKVITTGQGGMLVSKNIDLIEKAIDYREFDGRKTYYPRFNFQMTDIQAAIGIVQMRKLNQFLKNRKTIAEYYINICKQKNWAYQNVKNKNFIQNWYRFVLKLDSKLVNEVKERLINSGIKCIVPIEKWELLSIYLNLDSKRFMNCEKIAETTLSLPIFPDLLNNKDFNEILNVLREI